MSNSTAALPAGAIPLPPDPKNPTAPAWAVLKSADDLDGFAVMEIFEGIKGGEGYGKAATEMRVAILRQVVTNWSYANLPLPVTRDTLAQVPGAALLELFKQVKPIENMINGKTTAPVLTKETLGDEGSPTGGSSE